MYSLCTCSHNHTRNAMTGLTNLQVRLWNLDSFSERCAPAREYTCGSVPVMDVAYLGSILVAACRNGSVQVFDAIGGASRTLRAHRGHSTCVCAISSDEFITGGADGCIGFIDLRSRTDQPVASLRVHCNAEGAGAVGGMVLSNATETTPYVVSFGADRTVCLTDPRMSQRAVVQRWTSHRDFVYCMAIGVPFVFSGGGDGNIVCHDIRDGSVKFGLGACENGAVRCLRGSYKRLYVANDAGDVIRYSFT
jgi:WD40 repeat protein